MVSKAHGQLDDNAQLVLMHPEFHKPKNAWISGKYGISYRQNGQERVYAIFDLRNKTLLHSEKAEEEGLVHEDLSSGGYSNDPYIQTFIQTDLHPSNLANENSTEFNGRRVDIGEDGLVSLRGKTTSTYSAPEFTEFIVASDGVIGSISPDNEHVGVAAKNRVFVWDISGDSVVWVSDKLKLYNHGLYLLPGGEIVLPQGHKKNKYQHLVWIDYLNNKEVYSSKSMSSKSIVYVYQAYDYLALSLGDNSNRKISSSFYLDLKNCEYSPLQSIDPSAIYDLAYYIEDSLVRPRLSKTEADRYFDNYTIYPSWDQLIGQYYYVRYNDNWESVGLMKRLLTPMTVDTSFFTDNGYFGDNPYLDYEIISTFDNRVTYQDKSKDIPLYNIEALRKQILFWNARQPEGKRLVKLMIDGDGNPVFYTDDYYYFAPKGLVNNLMFEKDFKWYRYDQFDIIYNRPDIILERLGYADEAIINAYRAAYHRRLKKLGLSEEDLNQGGITPPEIDILNRDDLPLVVNDGKIELVFGTKQAQTISDINIWLNGTNVSKSYSSQLDKDTDKWAVEVELVSGNNLIEVSATNNAGVESNRAFINVSNTQTLTRDLFIIAIGVSDYEDADYKLNYAAKDAMDMIETFTSSKHFKKVYSLLLTDQKVGANTVEEAQSFLQNAKINDHVILFVAGHGVLDETYTYYYAPHDMSFNNPKEQGISYASLESILDGIKPIKKLFFMDTCHSGEIDAEDVKVASNSNKVEGQIKFRNAGATLSSKQNGVTNSSTSELVNHLFRDTRRGTGSTVISSSGGVEFAIEGSKWNNGLFTFAVLEGIKQGRADANSDGEITVSELKTYVNKRVSFLSNGLQTPTSRIENTVIDFRIW